MDFLNNVAIQWAIRRVPDWGGQMLGWVGGLLALYNSIPVAYRPIIDQAISGNWQSITLGGAFGFLAWGYSQVISYRATVKPQAVVEEGGKLVTNTLAPKKEKEVAEVVTNVSSRKSLWDILKGQ